jgi:tetratricopeptide (TPR) repeat protein
VSLRKISLLLLCLCLSLSVWSARAQDTLGNSVRPSPASGEAAMHGRLVLLLPFENHSNDPSVDWIGMAFPDIFSRRLAGADYLPLGREDRLYAFDHLGLPRNLQPSRALTIRIAQLVDADYVIVGSYKVEGNRITAQAQILDMAALTLTKPIEVNAALPDLLNAINSLAWHVVRKMDPQYAVAEQTFLAADGKLPPAAYESYIRGLIAPALTDQITYLKESIRIDPDFFPAWMQLGLAYFADQDYNLCAATLGHLPRFYSRATEADFYRGLSFFYLGDYTQAENAFAFVAESMPLPEVLNNEGVAASRRGQPAASFFRKAIAADPKNENYLFNLAVALARQHDEKGAMAELQTALKLNPNDTDAQSFLETLETPPPANPDPGHAITDTDLPLERIQRHYDGASVRQAAFELEQMQEMRLASMPAQQRAAALVKDGDQFLDRGLILEAEREYHAALAADSHSAMAHAGLAEVRERSGDDKAAKREARDSLAIEPNAEAHLVLARLDMEQKNLSGAKSEAATALKLDPGSAAAHSLNDALNKAGASKPGASTP